MAGRRRGRETSEHSDDPAAATLSDPASLSRSVSDEFRATTSDDDSPLQGPDSDVQLILSDRTDPNGDKSYYVKFFDKSYAKCAWIRAADLRDTPHNTALRKAFEKRSAPLTINPCYRVPEKIIWFREVVDGGPRQYLVKWCELDYSNVTWEDTDDVPPAIICDFHASLSVPDREYVYPASSEWRPILASEVPASVAGHTIRPYQLEGLNFLVNAWYNRRNAILADEMGLGKTMEALTFLAQLKIRGVFGPFLVVAPMQTIVHWERELREWTDLRHLAFYGSKTTRRLMAAHEMFAPDNGAPRFEVLLTTYEFAVKEVNILRGVRWRCIVVDEAHRLKNHESKLFGALMSLDVEFKLLMTGTPLQNNIGELWALLHYMDPVEFQNLTDFQQNFGQLNESEQVINLQSLLKPLMLRRMKSDVDQRLSPLQEIIIECQMTQHQRSY